MKKLLGISSLLLLAFYLYEVVFYTPEKESKREFKMFDLSTAD